MAKTEINGFLVSTVKLDKRFLSPGEFETMVFPAHGPWLELWARWADTAEKAADNHAAGIEFAKSQRGAA